MNPSAKHWNVEGLDFPASSLPSSHHVDEFPYSKRLIETTYFAHTLTTKERRPGECRRLAAGSSAAFTGDLDSELLDEPEYCIAASGVQPFYEYSKRTRLKFIIGIEEQDSVSCAMVEADIARSRYSATLATTDHRNVYGIALKILCRQYKGSRVAVVHHNHTHRDTLLP